MEAASSIADGGNRKRGRGRPKRLPTEVFSSPTAKTTGRRHAANLCYAYEAARVLIERRDSHPQLLEITGSIVDPLDGSVYPGTQMWVGPLAELGRALDGGCHKDVVVKIALELLGMQPRPTSKGMVARIREFRARLSGRELPQASRADVARVLFESLDAYIDGHPGTPAEEVLEGIHDVYRRYQGAMEHIKSSP